MVEIGVLRASLKMRPATIDDSAFLFDLRNQEGTRKFSRNQEPLDIEQHLSWLSRNLRSTDSHLFIFTFKNEPVGVTRLDELSPGVMEISINLTTLNQGRGFGRQMIKKTTDFCFESTNSSTIRAVIHGSNIVSTKLFCSLGFRVTENSGTFHIYEYKLV